MFKLLADECINIDVVLGLRKAGVDVLTVRETGLIGSDDDTIFGFASDFGRSGNGLLLTLREKKY